MKKFITGAYAVLLTPFQGNEVDTKAFVKQIELLNDKEIQGYVVNGSTSEFIQLSLKEQQTLTELAAEHKTKDKKLIVGACAGNISDCYEICAYADEVNADAVLVCPPYYFKYTSAEREEYFKNLADISPVPVLLYNIPFFTQELELEVIYRLFRHGNIKGIKDSSANMKRLTHLIEKTEGTELSVLTGTDDILFPALMGGCVGSMTAFATIYPDKINELYRCVETGNYARAKEIQLELIPKLREADSLTFPRGYKKLMEEVSGIEFKDKEAVLRWDVSR